MLQQRDIRDLANQDGRWIGNKAIRRGVDWTPELGDHNNQGIRKHWMCFTAVQPLQVVEIATESQIDDGGIQIPVVSGWADPVFVRASHGGHILCGDEWK